MSLLPVDDALALILEAALPSGEELLPLAQAGGRVSAHPVTAKLLQPPFDCSAMDGYAIIAPSEVTYPLFFTVIGESAAGKRFEGVLSEGQAVRIFTGAPMPENADTIIIQEDTERAGDKLTVLQGLNKGRHIRHAGLDFAPDTVIIPQDHELDAPALSLVAASGHAEVKVYRKPRVAILATGDELVPPGTLPGPDQIVASNSLGIAEIVRRTGGIAEDTGIIPDSLEQIEHSINDALTSGVDVLVTIGGASVGDRDFVHTALRNCGVALDFWKIAMRPGRPLMYGCKTVNGKTVHIIGLPGNPVSSLVCGLIFLRPLVAQLAGLRLMTDIRAAKLGVELPNNQNRRDFIRATVTPDEDGSLIATPFRVQDSSMLSALAHSQALIIRPENAPASKAGEPCRILML